MRRSRPTLAIGTAGELIDQMSSGPRCSAETVGIRPTHVIPCELDAVGEGEPPDSAPVQG